MDDTDPTHTTPHTFTTQSHDTTHTYTFAPADTTAHSYTPAPASTTPSYTTPPHSTKPSYPLTTSTPSPHSTSYIPAPNDTVYPHSTHGDDVHAYVEEEELKDIERQIHNIYDELHQLETVSDSATPGNGSQVAIQGIHLFY